MDKKPDVYILFLPGFSPLFILMPLILPLKVWVNSISSWFFFYKLQEKLLKKLLIEYFLATPPWHQAFSPCQIPIRQIRSLSFSPVWSCSWQPMLRAGCIPMLLGFTQAQPGLPASSSPLHNNINSYLRRMGRTSITRNQQEQDSSPYWWSLYCLCFFPVICRSSCLPVLLALMHKPWAQSTH